MTPRGRWLVLIVLLIAVIALVVFDRPAQDAAIVDAVAPRATSSQVDAGAATARAEPSEGTMILPIRPRAPAATIDDAFAALDWRPPPPPPPKSMAPPPPPTPPPLPYTVIGKKLEDGAWQVFLRRDERVLVVKTLDTIDDAYRVDEIRPPVMTLTYLPLKQRQNIPIGGIE